MDSVSVIICTRNRAASLRNLLETLKTVQIPPGTSVEFLVVDNGSTDETPRVATACRLPMAKVKYLSEPTPGQSRARNRGLAESTGDIIVFTDDDVIPNEDWLVKLCAPIAAGKADAVVGTVRLAPHLVSPLMSSYHKDLVADTSSLDPQNPGRMVGANMAFSRAVLQKVPAFDIELGPGAMGFGDDTLFSQQLRAAGYRVASAFDSIVIHHFQANRLGQREWDLSAEKLGRVDAYLSHHWEHETWPHPRRILFLAFLKLTIRRAKSIFQRKTAQTLESLLKAARHYHATVHYLTEHQRPRNYERHGLVKLSPTAAQ